MTRSTSAEAWDAYKNSFEKTRCRRLVIDILMRHGPLTSREIGDKANHEGLWKRLSELSKEGVVEEKGKRICSTTKRKVIVWGLTDAAKNLTHDQSADKVQKIDYNKIKLEYQPIFDKNKQGSKGKGDLMPKAESGDS